MKKVILSLGLLLGLTTSVFAIEWGGLVNNGTFVNTPDFNKVGINQSNEAYFWANSALNENETLRFAAEGMYRFTFDSMARLNENHGMHHALDVNVLKLSGNWAIDNNNLLLDLGRFNVNDKVGAYFNQKSDGLSLRYNTRDIKVGLYAGYTGLQNKNTTMMQKDMDTENYKDPKMLYDLTYAYVPLMADFTINKIGPLSLAFQASYFLDLKNKDNVAYGSLSLNGNMSNIGAYGFNVVVGSNNFKDYSIFGSCDLKFFVNQNVLVQTGADYGSGNVSKIKMSSFKPITVRPIGTFSDTMNEPHVIAPRLSGIFMIGDVLVSLNEKLTILVNEEKTIVNCLDSSLGVVYNVFSDLQVGATAIATLDFNQNANNNYGIMVNASLSF